METNLESQRRWYDRLTKYHYLVLVVASFGWMFDTMDQWLYILARNPAMRELMEGASKETIKYYSGIVQMWLVIGWATGGFVFGIIGDRLGRTRTMALTVLMYAGFTGLSGFAQTWEQFAALRFLTGLGIGGEFAAGAALVAEAFPAYSRPTALGIMQAASAIGNIMAGAIYLTIGPSFGWRWVFWIGFLPALVVFLIRLFIREPERWQQARASGVDLGSVREMFATSPWRRHAFVGITLAAVGVAGFWGIGTWSSDLLRGLPEIEKLPAPMIDRQVSLAIMAQNGGAFFGILLWAWLAQRIGRRTTFGLTFLACLLVVPLTFHLTESYTHALLLFPVMGFCTTALFGGYAVYFPELFPTRLRATGTGFCYNVARYLAAGAPFVFGTLSATYGPVQAATMLSIVFVLGLVVLPFAPETKGQPLPE